MGLQLHILAPGYSSPLLPKLFPASECFCFCLSHFLFSGSFQLPVSPAHPALADLQLFFLLARQPWVRPRYTSPDLAPVQVALPCLWLKNSKNYVCQEVFEVLMQGLSWLGTGKSSWGIRNQQIGHTDHPCCPLLWCTSFGGLQTIITCLDFCCHESPAKLHKHDHMQHFAAMPWENSHQSRKCSYTYTQAISCSFSLSPYWFLVQDFPVAGIWDHNLGTLPAVMFCCFEVWPCRSHAFA